MCEAGEGRDGEESGPQRTTTLPAPTPAPPDNPLAGRTRCIGRTSLDGSQWASYRRRTQRAMGGSVGPQANHGLKAEEGREEVVYSKYL